MEKKNRTLISDDILMNKIYIIRDQKVMLDRDLPELYGVETKYLKRQVKRNIDRFPEDFMFELSTDEFENLRCQFGTSKLNEANFLRSQFATSKTEDIENVDIEAKNSTENRGCTRYLPMAFTEQGIAVLSSILNSFLVGASVPLVPNANSNY
ncbi:MAG: ORF6N domain-containing protein [Crocinitomicaceae bacterium]|nr:ORF6N domain-containing protein [Crocinitomicaceae bacterium]